MGIQTHCMDEDEVPDEKWPGLSGLAGYLMQAFLCDKDPAVRLWTAASCLELLAVYAPDIPWDFPVLKQVWSEVLHQIAAAKK